jgi:hypothetical protein
MDARARGRGMSVLSEMVARWRGESNRTPLRPGDGADPRFLHPEAMSAQQLDLAALQNGWELDRGRPSIWNTAPSPESWPDPYPRRH